MKISVAIKLIARFALITCLFSCKKTLEEFNPSQNTAETVYTSPEGFETLVNAAYSYNRNWYGKEDGFGLSEMGTDLWTAGSESFAAASGLAGENRPLILYQNLSPVNQNVTRLWKQLYAAINLCNTGIKISTDGKFTPSPERVAELRFLRAFYYWHVVETWGGVHFTTEPTTTAVLTANRTPVDKFYELIISDLQIAVAILDDNVTDYGRVSQSAAKAFLARVYLTRGYADNSYFSLARDLAMDVINSSQFTLVPRYLDLWDMTKQKNAEVIWSVNYSDDVNFSDVYNATTNPYGYGVDILSANGNPTNNRGNNNSHALFISGYDRAFPEFDNAQTLKRDVRNGWPFIRFKPTRHLLDLFDETKDARYSGSFQTVWKVNYTNTTGRLVGKTPYVDTAMVITKNPAPNPNYYTYDVYNTYNPDGSSVGVNTNQLFPTLLKFQDSTRSASPNDKLSGNIQSARDVFVIRLAEMYLIVAEADFNIGNTSEAADYVNVIRTRAALPGMQSAMQVTSTDITLDFILDERAREFAGEQIRWFDLKRTGRLLSRVQLNNPDVGAFIQPFHALRPIPQIQMDVVTNKGEFFQNPGY
jgi:hypothetical protein